MPLLVDVASITLPFVAGFSCWALGRLAKRYNMEIDAQYRAYLNQAMLTGLTYATDPNRKLVVSRSNVVDVAARYVRDRVPGALKHFNIDNVALDEMMEARVNVVVGS